MSKPAQAAGWLALLLLLATAPADEPRPGTVFERRTNASQPVLVSGWRHLGGGYWGDANRDECCFDLFRSGSASILAIVEPVARDARGGMLSSRILETHRMKLEPNEDWATCSLAGRAALLAALDAKTGRVRGVFMGRDGFEAATWAARAPAPEETTYCEEGG
ncbi:MAG TPA: hypothetical protein VF589_10110 [Allosphingosinicella sp.]|jgi:hypothetical protein